jgi:hypothetical protein
MQHVYGCRSRTVTARVCRLTPYTRLCSTQILLVQGGLQLVHSWERTARMLKMAMWCQQRLQLPRPGLLQPQCRWQFVAC